ncbi:putative Tetratricopeptide repeat (TPR)-like superfamily protein [Hibiscus syriacus]|uniref:Tetratricopeptide repeat (TPR)-like superfamily protein n=1 Tax=Hibiscus syriacus TaxID=106335 RepID=A0A6A3BCH3_HIBSY|nr:putative Tetratricopeptide repeat (TPR)-like superfamily protein [Hibiscus syriacus]
MDPKSHIAPTSLRQSQATILGQQLLPSIWRVFASQGKEREGAMEAAVENLKFVEEELEGKRLFGGDKIGLADLAFGWLGNLIGVLEQVVGLRLIDERFPLLSAWIQEFWEIQIIKESWPSHDKLVVKYQEIYDKLHPLK